MSNVNTAAAATESRCINVPVRRLWPVGVAVRRSCCRFFMNISSVVRGQMVEGDCFSR